MRKTVCPLLACVTLLSTTLIGQNNAPVTADPSRASLPSDSIGRLHEFHKRAYEALHAEQERAKEPLCPKALNTVAIIQCISQEFGITDRNYTTEITALSALLGVLRDQPRGSVATTSFDEAEATWHIYREQACNAFAGPANEAGTSRASLSGSCLITTTRYHMNALGDLYTDVGMHSSVRAS
jgi:Lysozyme inhibitor LprI